MAKRQPPMSGTVKTHKGDRQVVYTYINNGLGVWKTDGGWYSLTHMASGCRIGELFHYYRDAVTAADKLAPLQDWPRLQVGDRLTPEASDFIRSLDRPLLVNVGPNGPR